MMTLCRQCGDEFESPTEIVRYDREGQGIEEATEHICPECQLEMDGEAVDSDAIEGEEIVDE